MLSKIIHHDKVNVIDPHRCGCNFECINFKQIPVIYILNISSTIVLKWIPRDLNWG